MTTRMLCPASPTWPFAFSKRIPYFHRWIQYNQTTKYGGGFSATHAHAKERVTWTLLRWPLVCTALLQVYAGGAWLAPEP
jgi:hypothetical protein